MPIRAREERYPLDREVHGLTVLPRERRGDAGVYGPGNEALVKQLRANGVEAAYLDEPHRRRWLELLGGDVTPDLIFAVGTGILSSALWSAVVAVLERVFGAKRKVRVNLVRQSRDERGALRNEWLEYEGPVEGLREAVGSVSHTHDDG